MIVQSLKISQYLIYAPQLIYFLCVLLLLHEACSSRRLQNQIGQYICLFQVGRRNSLTIGKSKLNATNFDGDLDKLKVGQYQI